MQLILLGAGGHATVLAEILQQSGKTLLGLASPEAATSGLLATLPYLGDDNAVTQLPADVQLVNGLGSTNSTATRARLFQHYRAAGYCFADVRHPSAIISPSAQTGDGLQALAGSLINSEAQLGDNVLINSRAVVEHHCHISDNCHIASGAVLCGDCRLKAGVHVGAGAIVKQGLHIGENAVIAAGAVVVCDVPEDSLAIGVPARIKPINR